MKINLLPHYFKRIGVSIFILALISLIIHTLFPVNINIEESILNWILKIFILASLLTLIFTKEKNESEKISQLRLNNILVSVVFGVAFLIIDTISELIFSDGEYDMKSGYEIMMIMLFYYLITFYIIKTTQRKKKVIAILILLLSVSIPILTLNLFPSSIYNDIYCMLFYYPLLFLIGGLSAWTYYQFRDRVKLNNAVLFLLILMLDFAILTSFYPKGEYSPTNQLRVARQVVNDYENLKPVEIFKAIDDGNFLRITALYHKFNLPTEFYVVRYCFNDTKGICDPYICDTLYKEFDYFFMDNRVVTNNPDFDYNLDLNEGSFSFTDTVEKIAFTIKFDYPNFGAVGSCKDIETLRVIVFETNSTFEYGFTNLFIKYLNITQGTKEKKSTA